MGMFGSIGSAVGSVFSNPTPTLVGAGIGAAVGGPPGAVIGASIGAGSTMLGSAADEKAKAQQQNLAGQFASWRQYAQQKAPTYQSNLSSDLSQWSDPSKMNVSNTYDPQYFKNLASYAQSTTDSPWLQLMKSRLTEQKMQNIADVAQQTAAAQVGAREQLASRRGLSSGAAERIATQGSLAGMFGRQKAGQDIGTKMQEAAIEEARQKIAVQGQLPGMEISRAQTQANIDQANLSRLLEERARQQQFAMDKYKTEMAAWAAEQQANAMVAAGQPQGLNKLFSGFI